MLVNNISEIVSSKIRNLSFVLTCLVVLIHTPGIQNGMIINDFILRYIAGGMGISCIAVPLFFVISGYFLGKHVSDDRWYFKAVSSRVRTLVIPFFLLNAIWLPVYLGIHYIGVVYFGAGQTSSGMEVSIFNIIRLLGLLPWGGNVVVGLWYLRALFYLILFSPILVYIISSGWRKSLFSLVIIFVVWSLQDAYEWPSSLIGPMKFEFSARCPLYFGFGLFVSQYIDLEKIMSKSATKFLVPLAGCVASVLWLLFDFNNTFMRHMVLFVMTIGLGLLLFLLMPASRWPKIMAGNSFPLFVLHGMIIYLISIIFKGFNQYNFLLQRIGVLPFFIVTCILGIIIAQTLKIFVPRFAKLLFGGR